jgi:hypothetical protein
MVIAKCRSEIAFPDPFQLCIQVIKRSQLDSLQEIEKKLRAIKGYVTLKIFFTLSPDLNHTLLGKTYQQLLSETNSLTETLSNVDVDEQMIDLMIARLAGEGPARDFAHECETFRLKMTYYKMMQFIIPIAKWFLVAIWITSFVTVTDFSEVENVITAIRFNRILFLWSAIIFFYVGRSLMDIYGKEKYFFTGICAPGLMSVKEFYEKKNKEMHLNYLVVNYFVYYY